LHNSLYFCKILKRDVASQAFSLFREIRRDEGILEITLAEEGLGDERIEPIGNFQICRKLKKIKQESFSN